MVYGKATDREARYENDEESSNAVNVRVCPWHQTITINQMSNLDADAEATAGMHDNRQSCFRFQFHHVLHNAAQDTIYEGLARDVIQASVDGISGEERLSLRR